MSVTSRKPSPWLSVGAGLSVQTARAVFSSSINSSTLTGRLLPLQDGLFNLRGDDVSVGYNFGVLIEPRAGTRIGLTYRSRIQHDFEGEATFDVPAPLSASPNFRRSPAGAKLVLPDTAGLSVTQEFDARWTGYLDVTWTNWSQFRRLSAYRRTGEAVADVPQNYRDSFFVAVGASYRANEWLTLRAGTAYDKTPVRDAFRTALVESLQDGFFVADARGTIVEVNTAFGALTGFVVLAGAYFVMNHVFYAQGVVSIIIELVGGLTFLIVVLRKGRL